ncbi:MAG: hypothetical protein PHC62_11305 [Candidatus Izemoplasmatales bacterium]|nr:hypothetical protein [Candidatus Izemoplasmatales bacterium]
MNNVEYAKKDAFKLQLLQSAEAGQKVYENTINKLNNCPQSRTLENKYTIKEIFSRYWEEFWG